MNKKILTIGSLTFDIFVRPKRQEIIIEKNESKTTKLLALPFGEKVRISEVHECFGGGAANTAISFKRLGIDSEAFGATGKDEWGKMILSNLKKEKVGTKHIQISKEKTGFSVILNSFEGERTVLAFAGANHAIEKIDEKNINKFDGVHLCHLSGKSAKVFDTIRRFFEKNPGKFLSWNPGKEQIEKGLDYFKGFLEVVDVLFLNKEEAEEFSIINSRKSSKFGSDISDFSEIFKKFFKSGFRGILVITDGKKGSQVCADSQIIYCEIDNQSPRKDTLGAGDAFASGFSASIIYQKDLITAIKAGTLNASSVVSYFGAQAGLLTKKKLESELKKKNLKISQIKLT